MQFAERLCVTADSSLEWRYLVNETLEGEKCIVPLLREISKHPTVSGPLREAVMQQLDEEVEHVRLYHALVGPEKIKGSGFKEKLRDYVDSLDLVTLKLFALQGMLEGIALGALRYRLENIDESPSAATDRQALIDEQNHVGLSFAHFAHLKRAEGSLDATQFKTVAKEVNAIFSSCFNGQAIAQVFQESFALNLDASAIENSHAMKAFRSLSSRTVIENKNLFLIKYLAV